MSDETFTSIKSVFIKAVEIMTEFELKVLQNTLNDVVYLDDLWVVKEEDATKEDFIEYITKIIDSDYQEEIKKALIEGAIGAAMAIMNYSKLVLKQYIRK